MTLYQPASFATILIDSMTLWTFQITCYLITWYELLKMIHNFFIQTAAREATRVCIPHVSRLTGGSTIVRNQEAFGIVLRTDFSDVVITSRACAHLASYVVHLEVTVQEAVLQGLTEFHVYDLSKIFMLISKTLT